MLDNKESFSSIAAALGKDPTTIIKQLKAFAKSQGVDKSYDPYKAAYGSMPSHASANPEILVITDISPRRIFL